MKKKKRNIRNKNIFAMFFPLVILIIFQMSVNAQSDATIYLDSTKQIIRGFGAANIVTWRPDMTTDEINTAFGNGDGQLGFSILRFRIPPDSNSFNINLPSAQAAYSMGVTLIASPWSPPASMKTNTSTVGGELSGGSYNDFALYLKSFADYMSSNGAPIYAISVQNEPDVSVTYESCDYNAAQMLKFIQENARSIGTKVIAPESFHFDRALSDPLLNDSTALDNFDIVGGHIYGGGLEPYPLAESKGKEVWMTEHLDTDTSWAHVLATGKEINDCMNDGMSAYVWWYIVRFYGPIDENGNVTKRGYIMSQYSKFIRPGFSRIEATSNPQVSVYLTAYKKGTQVIIVVVNNNSSSIAQTFTIPDGTASYFTPYITSTTKNFNKGSNITTSGNSFTATLDASSVTTFVSDGNPDLPVELTSFSAKVVGDKINLSWSTATEKNNSGFEIQRSADNKQFVSVGFVKGYGTTAERQSYSFVDNNMGTKLYYRLKQIDFDGSFAYSNVVEVSAVPQTFELSQNYPNPFNPTTKIKYSVPEKSYISLKAYNLLGEEVATLFEGYKQAGNYEVTFNGSGLSSGVYFYQLKAENFVKIKKLVLLK